MKVIRNVGLAWIYYTFTVLVNISYSAGRSCGTLHATRQAHYLLSHDQFGAEPYPGNIDACWKIKARSKDDVIKLAPIYFELEQPSSHRGTCSYDSVLFHCGRTGRTGEIDRYCGTQLRDSLYSDDRYMYVSFITDAANSAEGFNISYQSFPAGERRASCRRPTGVTLGTLIGSVFVGVLVVCVIVALVSCCVKGKARGFEKCKCGKQLTRRNVVYPIPCARGTSDDLSFRSSPSPSRSNSTWLVQPPAYSEVAADSPGAACMPSTTIPACHSVLANQNSTRHGTIQNGADDLVTEDARSNENRDRNRSVLNTRVGTQYEVSTQYEVHNTEPGGSDVEYQSRPEMVEYMRPPSGDPADFRNSILPISPPPPYEYNVPPNV